MRSIRKEIEIDATPEEVWEVLTDFAAYGEWNPFITSIETSGVVGERLRATLSLGGGRPMTLTPTLLVNDPAREFRWLGSMGVRGLFDGEHSFELEPTGSGTRLIHAERFTGILARAMLALVGRKTSAGFVAMNQALAARVAAAPGAERLGEC
jgi:hypothetical protein